MRVGVYGRRVLEEKKNFAGKANKIAQMLVRALEGLQPMVTGAFLEKGKSPRGFDAVKKSKEEWKFWNVMIIVFNIVGLAVVIFVIFRAYKHFEALRADFVLIQIAS